MFLTDSAGLAFRQRLGLTLCYVAARYRDVVIAVSLLGELGEGRLQDRN